MIDDTLIWQGACLEAKVAGLVDSIEDLVRLCIVVASAELHAGPAAGQLVGYTYFIFKTPLRSVALYEGCLAGGADGASGGVRFCGDESVELVGVSLSLGYTYEGGNGACC